MSSFTRAIFEPTGRSSFWRPRFKSVGGFEYEIGFLGSGIIVKVKDGAETDFTSVKWWALPFLRLGCMVRSSALHDELRTDERFTLLECDAIFLMAMETEGVPTWQREVCFLAVRTNRSRF